MADGAPKAKASGAVHWMGEKVHSGLEWAKKVGVAGGGMLKKGFSYLKKGMEFTPLGLAMRAAAQNPASARPGSAG